MVIVAFAALAGCTGNEPANPNLAAPKVLVQPRPDGQVTLFVHSAFGERSYEWLHVAVDNVTLVNRTYGFSVEETVAPAGFFLAVSAQAGQQLYETRARIDLDVAEERAVVSFQEADGKWSEPRPYSLPFGTILERRETA